MILIFGILLILYCIIAKKFNIWFGMLFVLIIMGFQEGIPGDYMTYKDYYIHGAEANVWGSTVKEGEFVYIWLTQKMHHYINFHCFVLITSIVQCIIIGLIIKECASRNYHYFGVLLVFFTFNIMLIQMKAMRQGYGVDCLLLSYYLLYKRRFLLSLIPIILAYGFHNSSIIAIPFFLILFGGMILKQGESQNKCKTVVVEKNKGVIISLWAVLGLLAFYFLKYVLFSSYVNPILLGLDAFEYSGYLDTFEENRSISWWILLYHAVVVYTVTLYYVNAKELYYRYLAILVIFALFLSIGTFGFGNLMRITAYFIIFSVVVFPNVAAMLSISYGKHVGVGFVLFNMAYIMYSTVRMMLSYDVSNGTGFAPYTFSFYNW